MSKEFEALEMLSNEIRYKKEFIGNDTYRLYIKKNEIELLEKYLTELKEIKEAEPSKAMNELNEIIEYITEDKKVKYKATILFDCEIIKDALLKAQEQTMKYNEINKTFSDSHICEIQKEFAKYTSLCEESKCDECPLGIGDGICLKNVFEQKWVLQIKAQELEKENAEYKEALRIIFEKNVDVALIRLCKDSGEYNGEITLQDEWWHRKLLTQEEFDLLKRWENGIN